MKNEKDCFDLIKNKHKAIRADTVLNLHFMVIVDKNVLL